MKLRTLVLILTIAYSSTMLGSSKPQVEMTFRQKATNFFKPITAPVVKQWDAFKQTVGISKPTDSKIEISKPTDFQRITPVEPAVAAPRKIVVSDDARSWMELSLKVQQGKPLTDFEKEVLKEAHTQMSAAEFKDTRNFIVGIFDKYKAASPAEKEAQYQTLENQRKQGALSPEKELEYQYLRKAMTPVTAIGQLPTAKPVAPTQDEMGKFMELKGQYDLGKLDANDKAAFEQLSLRVINSDNRNFVDTMQAISNKHTQSSSQAKAKLLLELESQSKKRDLSSEEKLELQYLVGRAKNDPSVQKEISKIKTENKPSTATPSASKKSTFTKFIETVTAPFKAVQTKQEMNVIQGRFKFLQDAGALTPELRTVLKKKSGESDAQFLTRIKKEPAYAELTKRSQQTAIKQLQAAQNNPVEFKKALDNLANYALGRDVKIAQAEIAKASEKTSSDFNAGILSRIKNAIIPAKAKDVIDGIVAKLDLNLKKKSTARAQAEISLAKNTLMKVSVDEKLTMQAVQKLDANTENLKFEIGLQQDKIADNRKWLAEEKDPAAKKALQKGIEEAERNIAIFKKGIAENEKNALALQKQLITKDKAANAVKLAEEKLKQAIDKQNAAYKKLDDIKDRKLTSQEKKAKAEYQARVEQLKAQGVPEYLALQRAREPLPAATTVDSTKVPESLQLADKDAQDLLSRLEALSNGPARGDSRESAQPTDMYADARELRSTQDIVRGPALDARLAQLQKETAQLRAQQLDLDIAQRQREVNALKLQLQQKELADLEKTTQTQETKNYISELKQQIADMQQKLAAAPAAAVIQKTALTQRAQGIMKGIDQTTKKLTDSATPPAQRIKIFEELVSAYRAAIMEKAITAEQATRELNDLKNKVELTPGRPTSPTSTQKPPQPTRIAPVPAGAGVNTIRDAYGRTSPTTTPVNRDRVNAIRALYEPKAPATPTSGSGSN